MPEPLALIIEDDPEQVRFFERVLETAEYETASAGSGQQALAFLQKTVPHLILLDLHLPDSKGSDILTEIQQDDRLNQATVIIASADGTFAGYMWERADFVLAKPVSFHQLQHLALRLRP